MRPWRECHGEPCTRAHALELLEKEPGVLSSVVLEMIYAREVGSRDGVRLDVDLRGIVGFLRGLDEKERAQSFADLVSFDEGIGALVQLAVPDIWPALGVDGYLAVKLAYLAWDNWPHRLDGDESFWALALSMWSLGGGQAMDFFKHIVNRCGQEGIAAILSQVKRFAPDQMDVVQSGVRLMLEEFLEKWGLESVIRLVPSLSLGPQSGIDPETLSWFWSTLFGRVASGGRTVRRSTRLLLKSAAECEVRLDSETGTRMLRVLLSGRGGPMEQGIVKAVLDGCSDVFSRESYESVYELALEHGSEGGLVATMSKEGLDAVMQRHDVWTERGMWGLVRRDDLGELPELRKEIVGHLLSFQDLDVLWEALATEERQMLLDNQAQWPVLAEVVGRGHVELDFSLLRVPRALVAKILATADSDVKNRLIGQLPLVRASASDEGSLKKAP